MAKGGEDIIVLQGKPMGESRTVLTDLVFPNDTNQHGTIFGGKVMAHIDKVAAIAAMRHCRRKVVTASTDSVDFLAPIRTGEIICLTAFVSWTGKTSMEVYVRVESENLMTGERRLTTVSYLTFVALDDEGNPTAVPPVIPETPEEKSAFAEAAERNEIRKKRRENIKKCLLVTE